MITNIPVGSFLHRWLPDKTKGFFLYHFGDIPQSLAIQTPSGILLTNGQIGRQVFTWPGPPGPLNVISKNVLFSWEQQKASDLYLHWMKPSRRSFVKIKIKELKRRVRG